MTSIMNGRLSLSATIDSARAYPVQLQSSIQNLRARGIPGKSQDYRIAAQAKQPGPDTWLFGVNLQAGEDSSPSTEAEVAGSLSVETLPLTFAVDLKSERIRQSDLSLLAAAFSPSADRSMQPRLPMRQRRSFGLVCAKA